jgi:beta-fructofuranosidase
MEVKSLDRAREYEKENGEKIPRSERPVFHFTPYVGWMNDPNGFSFYRGKYHLFYQYNPYDTKWDSMHWGHAVSDDLIRWDYLPAALAPEDACDHHGCFSGTAMELEDGRHFIMYTGVKSSEEGKDHQTQCIAVGDGLNYVKYENNPVISAGDLPEGLSPYDFRDPKVFRDDDGKFYCIAAGKNEKGLGQLLLYGSSSGFDWHYENTFLENDGEFGSIWECPDFFLIDETAVVLTSPIGMEEKGYEYHSGNGTLCQIGIYDRSSKRFIRKSAQVIDHGADFYAPQTLKAPDGRRIMIGWMQSWATCNTEKIPGCPWFGQMSIARELTIKEDRLIQNPVREIELFRKDKTEYKNVIIEKKKSLEGIRGRSLDMTVSIRPFDNENIYDRFTIYFAGSDKHFSR